MWLFRELGAPYIFLHALLNPGIRWRNLEFRLQWGGKAEVVVLKPTQIDYTEQKDHVTKDYKNKDEFSLDYRESKSGLLEPTDYYVVKECGYSLKDYKMVGLNDYKKSMIKDYHMNELNISGDSGLEMKSVI